MTISLRYGIDSELRIEPQATTSVLECRAPRGEEHSDPFAATLEALSHPLGYPPLNLACVPGDKVTLALDFAVPQADAIVAAIVHCLRSADVAAQDITILRTPGDAALAATDPRGRLDATDRGSVSLLTHDPTVRRDLGYLGASADGRPHLMHRAILDADLVVAVGRLECSASPDYYGDFGGVFPAFSDQASQHRLRNPGTPETRASKLAAMRQEIDEVAWLLGARFAVQVIPAEADAVGQVLAGDSSHVFRRGEELCRERWAFEMPHRASLVVGAIRRGSVCTDWRDVARALEACSRLVEDEGVIAICCDLATPPGDGLRHLPAFDDPYLALKRIRKERPADAWMATLLVETLARCKVYFLSQLDEATVEELGMVPIAQGSDLARLVARSRSCILVSNAQHVMATAREDSYAADAGT